MYISKMYEYEINGIIEVSSNVPEGAIINEELTILNADNGYYLERIEDRMHFKNIWLKNGDIQDNYIEVIIEDKDLLKYE